MSSDTAASCLLDVVVFAGDDSLGLMPLSTVEQKTMLRICNRPLIWYTITPWIDAGFSTFFLCVNEDYAALRAYLSRAFSGVDFHFILVPSNVGDHVSTTCDAVKAYLRYKEALRLGGEDPLIASADVGEHDDAQANTERGGSTSGGRDAAHYRGSGTGAGSNARRSNTGRSVGSRDPLKLERMNSAGLQRDAILLSCDTIMVDVDIASFVERHYTSVASVTSMLYRPLRQKERKSCGGGRSKGTTAPVTEVSQASFTYAFSCVAYEESDAANSTALAPLGRTGAGNAHAPHANGGGQSGQQAGATVSSFSTAYGATPVPAETSHVSHHRLHYLYPLEGKPEVRVTMAFAARRPNLTFAADVVDAHVYLVSRWVLDFIAESAGIADMTVRKDVIPLLARSQHTMVNTSEKSFVTPSEKLHMNIPLHWTGEGSDLSVESLNSACGLPSLGVTDSLRVFCCIYEEHPDAACRIFRMNNRNNYRVMHQEIITAKRFLLNSDEPAVQDGGGSVALSRRGDPPSLLQQNAGPLGYYSGLHGAHAENVPQPSLSAVALASLLPDSPITVKKKVADQQVYIVSSFIDSIPPPNVFITRSVIGAHVKLEPGARITDSILMGNVEVGAKAVVVHSVIGTGAVVNAECRVAGTIVAPRCVVEENVQDTVVE